MQNNKNRIEYIDLFKGIGIVIMIMGHIGFPKSFNIIKASFNMPMFFFISGFLLKEYDSLNFIRRKFKALILPYLEFGLFNFVMCLFLVDNFKVGRYFERFFFFNNHKALDICGALWFFTALFFVNIIYYFLHKYLQKKYLLIVITAIVTIEAFYKIRLPFSIDSAIYMLPVFLIGYEFKKYYKTLDNLKLKTLLYIISIATIPLVLYNHASGVRTHHFHNLFIYYPCMLIDCISIFYLSKDCVNLFGSKLIIYIGKNSLNYMCLNQLIILLLNRLGVINDFMCLLFTLLSLYLCNECLNRIPSILKN